MKTEDALRLKLASVEAELDNLKNRMTVVCENLTGKLSDLKKELRKVQTSYDQRRMECVRAALSGITEEEKAANLQKVRTEQDHVDALEDTAKGLQKRVDLCKHDPNIRYKPEAEFWRNRAHEAILPLINGEEGHISYEEAVRQALAILLNR